MRRLIPAFGGIRWPDQAIRLAKWQNPVVASPAAPLETVAAMFALHPLWQAPVMASAMRVRS